MKEQIGATNLTERDGYADFLKYILIALVVLGHFINLYQNTKGFGGVYAWIYTFHMPLFVFISGHFSKHISNYRQKSIDTLLWPFAIFQILNILYTAIIPIEPLSHNIFYPYHQNWYLIALFWWRSLIPYRQFFNKGIVIVLAFLFSLSVGFYPEWCGFMGLYKTAYFLPFFVLGVYCEDITRLLSKLMKHKVLWVGVFIISIAVVIALSLDSNLLQTMNYAFKADLGYSGNWQNLLLRLLAMFVALVMCASVLVIVRLLYNTLKNREIELSGGGVQCYAS